MMAYNCNSWHDGIEDNDTASALPLVDGATGNRTSGDIRAAEVVENYVIPCVLALGLVGNLTSMVVFSQKRVRHGFDAIEQSATVGLMALALSDFCFCLIGTPIILLHTSGGMHPSANSVLRYITFLYHTYHKGLLNLFMCSSTWVTVLVSVERYIAVCHPFKAQTLIGAKRTFCACVLIFLLAIGLNVPQFLKYDIQQTSCSPSCAYVCYYYFISKLFLDGDFYMAYMITWSVLGTLVPFLSLVYCNARLIIAIQRSRARGIVDADRYSTSRITLILVVIVCLYLILVCPSSALALLVLLAGQQILGRGYVTAYVITNLTQAINFSVNFLLYVIMCKQFRRAIASRTCRKALNCQNQRCNNRKMRQQALVHIPQQNRYQMVYRPHI